MARGSGTANALVAFPELLLGKPEAETGNAGESGARARVKPRLIPGLSGHRPFFASGRIPGGRAHRGVAGVARRDAPGGYGRDLSRRKAPSQPPERAPGKGRGPEMRFLGPPAVASTS